MPPPPDTGPAASSAAPTSSRPNGPFDPAGFETASEALLAQLVPSPVRGLLAAQLVLVSLATAPVGPDTPDERYRRLDRMAAESDAQPPTSPEWAPTRAGLRAEVLVRSVTGLSRDPASALRDLEELAETVGGNARAKAHVDSARTRLTMFRDVIQGYQAPAGPLHQAVEDLQAAAGTTEAAGRTAALHEAIGLLASDDIEPAMTRVFALLRGDADQNPEVDGPPGGFLEAFVADLRNPGTDSPAKQALLQSMIGAAALSGEGHADAETLAQAIARFESVEALPDSPVHAVSRVLLAHSLFERGQQNNDLADVRRAVEILEAAKRATGGEHDPLWPMINDLLGRAESRLGETGSHATVLEGLRGRAWQVLLQDDVAAARAAAGKAARAAADAGRLCLAETDLAGALAAFDGGRALMLFSAVEFGDVAPRLEAAGHTGLADRWRRTVGAGEPDRMPTNLRADVLSVLTDGTALLDPPRPAEIRQALAALGADTLVYLIPGDGDDPGWALFVPARGPMGYVALPDLRLGPDSEVDLYLAASRPRDFVPAGPRRDLTGRLKALSEWSWRAAIGPVLDHCLPADRPAGATPRIVLVPMGRLALVPWQAARHANGTYAVQLATFSQTPSARMFCRGAHLPPVAPGPVGLVIGDPDTGRPQDRLEGARLEAFAIHRAFYRDGRYLGLRADGTPSPAGRGSAEELRAWFAGQNGVTGSVLHLACHGVVDTASKTPDSYLVLADGSRARAGEIVRWAAGAPGRAIGLAVLAACHTARSAQGYDEAYSLGTALLAAGVRSVISAQWAVPDDATSVLMFMVHHYVVAERLPAGEALRRAQLWMLDTDREMPATMPGPLRGRIGGMDLTRLDAWAGFVHFGR